MAPAVSDAKSLYSRDIALMLACTAGASSTPSPTLAGASAVPLALGFTESDVGWALLRLLLPLWMLLAVCCCNNGAENSFPCRLSLSCWSFLSRALGGVVSLSGSETVPKLEGCFGCVKSGRVMPSPPTAVWCGAGCWGLAGFRAALEADLDRARRCGLDCDV